MPTYEYRCKLCKHHFEKLQPIASKPLRTCPSCGKKTLERVIGMGGGILVAGSGGTGSDRGRDEALSASAGSSTSGAGAKADATAAGNAGTKGAGTPSSKDSAATAGAKPGAGSGDANKSTGKGADAGGSSGADPDRAAWKSKATHSSREGRGLGNLGSILKGAPSRGPGSGSQGGGGRGTSPGRNAPRRRSP